MMNKEINSLVEQVTWLKKIIDQNQAMINFQTMQHNSMFSLGIEREKKIINLEHQISQLKDKLTEQNDES